MNESVSFLRSKGFYLSIIVVVAMFALLYLTKKYLVKVVAYRKKANGKANTLSGVAVNLVQYLIVLIAVFIIIEVNGYSVTGVLTGFGVAATIIGLALQDAFKDAIMGLNIYSNNFYHVGDVVMYDGEMCVVKYFTTRITKFQTLSNGSTITVCNRVIDRIRKVKDEFSIKYYFPVNADQKKISKMLENVVKECQEDKVFKSLELAGPDMTINSAIQPGLKPACLAFTIKIKCDPVNNGKAKKLVNNAAYKQFSKSELFPNTIE